MKRVLLSILAICLLLLAACSSTSNTSTTSTSTPTTTTTTALTQTTTTTTTIPMTTISPTDTTRQAILDASRVNLVINQSNQEVEPEFSNNLVDYISFLLAGQGLALVDPGEKYDILLTFNLIAEPLGAEYQGAEDLCYTGADVSGEVVVTPHQGNPLHYDFYGYKPTTQGHIIGCNTKKEAPFPQAYEVEMLSIIADLWGVPMYVYFYIWRTDFLSLGIVDDGPPQIIRTRQHSEAVIAGIQAIGTDAIPPLIELLSSDNGKVRWAAAAIMGSIDLDITQAIPDLIECLHDPFVIVAALPQYDDLYPVREAALRTLISTTGQDFGYDEDQWQNWWEAVRSD